MSVVWNAWACRVDEKERFFFAQIEMLFAEMEKRGKQIERLERQNWDLHDRVWRLEEANQSTQVVFVDDSDSAQIQHREEDDSTLNPAIVALHGGYVNPKPHPVRMPMPVMLPKPWDPPLMYPTPPTLGNLECMRICVERGWHTENFNKWTLESQLNSGEPFKPGDTNYAYSNYCKRLCTWSLNVGLHQDSTCNNYLSTLD